MGHTVYHAGYGVTLNLTKPSYDHPEIPGLRQEVDRIWRDKIPGLLYCPHKQCDHCDLYGTNEMHLVQDPPGRYRVRHNPYVDPDRTIGGESDEHKAWNETIARTGEQAGFTAKLEARSTDGAIRTDCIIRGAVDVGWETQLTPIAANTVAARVRAACRSGLTPSWVTSSRDMQTAGGAPWNRFNDMKYHDVLKYGAEAELQGGIVRLDLESCRTMSIPCPDWKPGGPRRCGGYHWIADRPIRMSLAEMVRRSGAGELVPLYRKARNLPARWVWVTPQDKDRYLQGRPEQQPFRDVRIPRQAVDEPLADDVACVYRPQRDRGEYAPEPTRPVYQLPPALTDTERARAAEPRVCGAGSPRCGEPARLYPCGWRCSAHITPSHVRTRPAQGGTA